MKLDEWLDSVPGLGIEALRQAKHAFWLYNVDTDLLDFLVSEDGTKILKRYQRGPADSADCVASACDAGSQIVETSDNQLSSGAKEPERSDASGDVAHIAEAPAADASAHVEKSTAGRRQRISAVERRSEAHYFQQKPTRTAGRGSQGYKQGASDGATHAAQGASGKHDSSGSKSKASDGARKQSPHQEQHGAVTVAATTPTRSSCLGQWSPIEMQTLQSPEKSQPLSYTPDSGYNATGKDAEPAAWLTGALKSFSDEKGYGFLKCDGVFKDIFVRRSDMPSDDSIEIGRAARFRVEYNDKEQPQARECSWDTANFIQSGVSVPLVPSRHVSDRRFSGVIKSVGDKCAFIDSPEVRREFGDDRDIYVPLAQLPASARPQLKVSFVLASSARGQPQARDVLLTDDIDGVACLAFEDTLTSAEASASAPAGVRRKW